MTAESINSLDIKITAEITQNCIGIQQKNPFILFFSLCDVSNIFVIFLSQIAMPAKMMQAVVPPHPHVLWVKETVTMILIVMEIQYVELTTVTCLQLLGLILPLIAAQQVKDYTTTMVVAGTSKNQFLSLEFECGGIHKL